jgi:hypothetical protein
VGVEPLGQGESAFVQRRLVGAVVLAHLLDGPGVARPQVRQLLVRPMTAVAVRTCSSGYRDAGSAGAGWTRVGGVTGFVSSGLRRTGDDGLAAGRHQITTLAPSTPRARTTAARMFPSRYLM